MDLGIGAAVRAVAGAQGRIGEEALGGCDESGGIVRGDDEAGAGTLDDARGFIFGAALAQKLRAGFVPLRKPGKLPPPVVSVDYQLEYGSDRLQAQRDSLKPGERVLLIDDVLATGGTLAAARLLVEQLGAELVGASVVIELPGLQGRGRWRGDKPLHSLLRY